jgi:hypothetical protein
MAKTGRGATDVIDKISDQIEARSGTQLGPPLLAEARLAVDRAREAKSAGRWQDELGPTITAILCAHAGVEATVNGEANRLDQVWFAANEKLSLEDKWSWVIQQLTGRSPAKGGGPGQSLRRLCADRNLIAHFKGVRQPGGVTSVEGPPDTSYGGITRVRAHFNAVRAERSLVDAKRAISAIRP